MINILGSILIATYTLWYYNIFNIFSEIGSICNTHISRFKMVRNIVGKNVNYFSIFLTALKLILKTIWLMLIQKILHKNVIKISKDIYELTFYIKGQKYIFLLESKSGPNANPVLQVIDDQNNDVTDIVDPYINVYVSKMKNITPNQLGFDNLTFELNDGTNITCSKYHPLELNFKES